MSGKLVVTSLKASTFQACCAFVISCCSCHHMSVIVPDGTRAGAGLCFWSIFLLLKCTSLCQVWGWLRSVGLLGQKHIAESEALYADWCLFIVTAFCKAFSVTFSLLIHYCSPLLVFQISFIPYISEMEVCV